MSDRNVINGTAAVVFSPLVDFYSRLWPFVLVALVLIIADLRFGVEAEFTTATVVKKTGRGYVQTIGANGDFNNDFNDDFNND